MGRKDMEQEGEDRGGRENNEVDEGREENRREKGEMEEKLQGEGKIEN